MLARIWKENGLNTERSVGGIARRSFRGSQRKMHCRIFCRGSRIGCCCLAGGTPAGIIDPGYNIIRVYSCPQDDGLGNDADLLVRERLGSVAHRGLNVLTP